MKKERFIDLVCARLSVLGASESEIAKQRTHINGYLTGLGIGEEAEELDYESPNDFADEIFEIIKTHMPAEKISEPMAVEDGEDDIKIFEPNTAEEDDDIKVFDPNSLSESEDIPIITKVEECQTANDSKEDIYDALGNELESEISDYYDEEELAEPGATREFSLQDLISEDFGDEADMTDDDYYDEDDIKPIGNPVFFWILTFILSPLWIPLAAAAAVIIVALYILLSLFIVLYIPLLIVLILGGSVAVLAELVYSIVKFVTGQIHIGLFELGLGFFIAALTLCLSVLIYRFGTKYAPKIWKKYWQSASKLFKKLKRLIRKLKGVCSI